MKKIIIASVLAICVVAASQQQASAWVNSRFSMGLNWENQSAGNSFLWGAWRNGQIPGPEMGGGGGAPFGPSPYGVPYPGPRFGQQPGPMPYPQAGPTPGAVPGPQGMMYEPQFGPGFAGSYSLPYAVPYASSYSSPYQFANYPRQNYYYPASWYYGR